MVIAACVGLAGAGVAAAVVAADARFEPLRDFNGSFPFAAPNRLTDWEARRADVRRRVLVAQGLWPAPIKTPLAPAVHGTIDVDDPLAPGGGYRVSNVCFESLPGFFVTGNLYRPRRVDGRAPGVLFAHGHRLDARVAIAPPDAVRKEIASGAERFEHSGGSLYQSMCVQLVRMGCVVWHWDMLGDSDSHQLPRDLVHCFAAGPPRPEMNAADRFGLFSARAEARLITAMGLQTWNSIRGLDFLLSQPDVDPERVAMTGSSGGGTQTMLLAAVDDRLALSFPVVMVSAAMQGGCTCENAALLRIGTGNVELAALFAPKPQGMNTADDWTKELATKGFPDLQRTYGLYAAADRLLLHRGEHFPHNYNAVTRSAFYTFLNRQFRLGFPEPVIEHDFEPRSREALSVWGADHPPPPSGPDFERGLVTDLAADIDRQVREAATTRAGVERLLRPAFETILNRSLASAGAVDWRQEASVVAAGIEQLTGSVVNTTHAEEVPIRWLRPQQGTGRVVIWLDAAGRDSLADGRRPSAVDRLLAEGTAVIAADLYHARDAAAVGGEPRRQRTVKDKRDYAGFTFGYNDPAVVRSGHDILTLVRHVLQPANGRAAATGVAVAAFGEAAVPAAAARIMAGGAIDRMVLDTGGFRFAALDDWRHPLFLPGAVRYLDLPGMIAAGTGSLWLAGETAAALVPGGDVAAIDVHDAAAGGQDVAAAAVAWLLKARPAAVFPGRPRAVPPP